eukprot:CAMPEP_0202960028 /NCGR_PEP_ID=MMETSP1396-20130829/4209_1 /ASSEMBLY_ACC=CAM_ASM_000872 /TAXON_ID= /ORGANISM="Pseudokeronopsis sp., Strain Brazil" /LENGTH=300 /DNA_ID=CAMNT_0049678989 /DNA_START=220 /DNA_END=1122 /DNA_ORIENTATION=-
MTYCCLSAEYFSFKQSPELPPDEYLVVGADDGALHVYNYGKNKGQSPQKKIFRVEKQGEEAVPYSDPESIFQDTMYEHFASLTQIEKHPSESSLFLTAGKDKYVTVWGFNPSGGEEVLNYKYHFGPPALQQKGLLTMGDIQSAKWLQDQVIVAALADGTLSLKDIRTPKEQVGVSLMPRRDCAIWDMDLLQSEAGANVVCADDSGFVFMVDPRQNAQVLPLLNYNGESALKLNIEKNIMTVAFDEAVRSFRVQNGALTALKEVSRLSDNVSSLITLLDPSSSPQCTIFGTFDGRIHSFTY